MRASFGRRESDALAVASYRLVLVASSAALMVGLAAGQADAQIFSQSARTQFFTGFGIRTFGSYAELGTLLSDGDEIDDPLERTARVRVTPIGIVYGLRPGLSLQAVFPMVDKELTFAGPTGSRSSGSGYGLGDALFLAKWRFFKVDRPAATFQLALEGGVKAPTGEDDGRNGEGVRLPPALQRGTGSWDPTLNFQLTWVPAAGRGRWVFSGDIGYLLTTESGGFEAGDRLVYDAAGKYRVHPAHYPGRDTFLVLELNGRSQDRSRAADQTLPSSGGDILFVSPGIQFLVKQNIVLEGGVQIPIVRDLNGTQLGADFNVLVGARFIIVP